MAGVYTDGTPLRRLRERQGARMRQRGGTALYGEVTQVDHTGADGLTSATTAGATALGTVTTASSARATSLKITGLVGAGATVGVTTERITDDYEGRVAYDALGGGEDVLVEALVEVHASATVGSLLVASAVGGVGCFRCLTAESGAVAYARLEEAATAAGNDQHEAIAGLRRRWVQLISRGVPSGVQTGGEVGTADLANDAVTDTKLRNSAALSVIGRSANTVGDPADIVGADGQVLRVSGTTLGFGTIVAGGIASDAVTTAKILDSNVTAAKIAALTFNAQTGTTYTLAASDRGLMVTLTNGAAITLTVPLNASVAIPVGFECAIFQGGAGLVSVAAEGGVTINSLAAALDLAGQYAAATLIKTATDTWMLIGGIA